MIPLLALLLLPAILWSAPVVDGPEVQAFLGGRTGKMVYQKNSAWQLYFVDFSDSILVEKKISNDERCLNPMISPDGTRVLYASNGTLYIRDLIENSPTRQVVANNPAHEQHWWNHPTTGAEYITYTSSVLSSWDWPPMGPTYIQKIANNKPDGSAQQLMPFMMTTARSRDGLWSASAYQSVGMYKMYPEKIQNAFFDSYSFQDHGSIGACNASISPSSDPARQDRMMHLTSGFTHAVTGRKYENHEAVLIRKWTDQDVDNPFWVMGIPGIGCNNDSSGNLFWNFPEWSNDEDYFTINGSKVVTDWDTADIYMARINLAGESRILRILKGGGINWNPHLWVKTGLRPAKIRLDVSSLSFAAYKKDSLDPAPQTVRVSNAGDGKLPLLKIDSLPAWLTVSITGNGTDSARLVHSVSRKDLPPGDYKARVRVSYGQYTDSLSYPVDFRFSDPVLTRLDPRPARAVVRLGDTLRLKALALDQLDSLLQPQPSVTWSSAGNLQLSSDGLITAGNETGGPYAVIGKSGSVACTVQVHVSRTHIRLDAGTKGQEAAPGWVSEDGYVLNVSGVSQTRRHDTVFAFIAGAKKDPAPPQVYQTYSYPSPAYLFPALPDGRYLLRLHFATPSALDAAKLDSVGLSVWVGGKHVLTDYRLPADKDSLSIADIREVEVSARDSGGIAVSLAGLGPGPSPAFLHGLELFDIGASPVTVLFPNGGESFRVGDTLSIRWETDTTFVASCNIRLSVDSGKTWMAVNTAGSIGLGEKGWGDYTWIIPDSLQGKALASTVGLVSVYDYFGADNDKSNRVFTILARDSVLVGNRKPTPFAPGFVPVFRSRGHNQLGVLGLDGPYRLILFDLRGKTLLNVAVPEGGEKIISLPGPGLYRIDLIRNGRRRSYMAPAFF